jgi:hypothetical protein
MQTLQELPELNEPVAKQGIVILGVPRSGTTLLRRIINAHPGITCSGETFLLRATARFLESDSVADGIDYGVLGGLEAAGFERQDVLERLRQLAFGFLDQIAGTAGKPRWANKTAIDSFYVEQLEEIYGGHVKFICMLRHGLDTVCSLHDLCEANQTYIAELHRYIVRHRAPLDAFAHAWSDVTTTLLDLVDRRPEEATILRYEDLVRSPHETLESLFEFLEEKYESDLLDQAFRENRVQGLGDWKTYGMQDIEKSSVSRYQTLSSATISRLGEIVNATLQSAGYEPVPVEPQPNSAEAMRRYELQMTFKVSQAQAKQSEQ